jgi:hypothetical protein
LIRRFVELIVRPAKTRMSAPAHAIREMLITRLRAAKSKALLQQSKYVGTRLINFPLPINRPVYSHTMPRKRCTRL